MTLCQRLFFDQRDDHFHRTLPEAFRRLRDGGQRRVAIGRQGDVVEPGQRNILRHPQAHFPNALQRADGHLVTLTEQRGRPLGGAE